MTYELLMVCGCTQTWHVLGDLDDDLDFACHQGPCFNHSVPIPTWPIRLEWVVDPDPEPAEA